MDHVRHHTPDREFGAGEVDIDGRQAAGLGDQTDLVECSLQAADQHFAVQAGNNHLAIGGFHRVVDDVRGRVNNLFGCTNLFSKFMLN